MSKRYSQPILPDGSEVIFPSDTRIVEHGGDTLEHKLNSLDSKNIEHENRFNQLDNDISESVKTSKEYTDQREINITESYNNAINNESKKIDNTMTYKTSLAKNLQYKQRSFIEYTKNDSNLHLQGMCKLNDTQLLISYGTLDSSTDKGTILLYDLTTDRVINTFKNVTIFHSNDISYRKETNEVYVASMYDVHHTNLTVLDYSSMTKKRVIDLSQVVNPNNEDVWVIGVDCHETYYWIATAEKLYKLTYNNEILSQFNIINPDNVLQGITEVNDYVYIAEMWNILVYDIKGNLIRNFNLPHSGEIESIVHDKEMNFIISHSNNAFKEQNDTLKNIDLSQNYNQYFWTVYDNLDMLGIYMGSENETIENICATLGSRTKLYWQKINDNPATCYPSNSGLLEVTKYSDDKVALKFTRASATNGDTWVGNYNVNLSPKFSGWKKLNTSSYIASGYGDIGLTLDDFTTDFSTNVNKIITNMGANRMFVYYPWSGQDNPNLYNSIKTWCGVTSDGYTLKIESSVNGQNSIVNKITVIPNVADGNNIEIYSYYDNALGTPKTMVSLETVKNLIATAKTEVLATCDTKYQPKTSV